MSESRIAGSLSLFRREIPLTLLVWFVLPSVLTALPLKIMPLGDSRTAGPSSRDCYRLYLDRMMTAAGYSFDFVGTEVNHAELQKAPDSVFDVNHQGMWGWTTGYILRNPSNGWEKENIGNWARAHQPDMALVLLGTTDLFYFGNLSLDRRLDTIEKDVGKVIDTLQKINPSINILLASLYPVLDTAKNVEIVAFNRRIPAMAQAKSKPSSLVIFVDLWTGFDRTRDLVDWLHANQTGSIKIAQRWLEALWPFFDTIPPTAVRTARIIPHPAPQINASNFAPWAKTPAVGIFDLTGRLMLRNGQATCIRHGLRCKKEASPQNTMNESAAK